MEEWKTLVLEALAAGIKPEEIRSFLQNKKPVAGVSKRAEG